MFTLFTTKEISSNQIRSILSSRIFGGILRFEQRDLDTRQAVFADQDACFSLVSSLPQDSSGLQGDCNAIVPREDARCIVRRWACRWHLGAKEVTV
jgi:hypothetical protein